MKKLTIIITIAAITTGIYACKKDPDTTPAAGVYNPTAMTVTVPCLLYTSRCV